MTNLPIELTSLLQNLKELMLCNNNLENIDLSSNMFNLFDLDLSGNQPGEESAHGDSTRSGHK